MKNKTLLPYLAMLLAAILLVLCFLLPYGTAKGEYRQWLKGVGDTVVNAKNGLTGNDFVQMSLLEYAKLNRMNVQNGIDRQATMTRQTLIVSLAFFCLLTALFSALKKPAAAIALCMLTLLNVFILSEDFSWNGIVPGKAYDCGSAYVLFYILPLIVIAAAIWLLIARKPKAAKEEN